MAEMHRKRGCRMGAARPWPEGGVSPEPKLAGGGRRQVAGGEIGALGGLCLGAREVLIPRPELRNSHVIKSKSAEKRQPGDREGQAREEAEMDTLVLGRGLVSALTSSRTYSMLLCYLYFFFFFNSGHSKRTVVRSGSGGWEA